MVFRLSILTKFEHWVTLIFSRNKLSFFLDYLFHWVLSLTWISKRIGKCGPFCFSLVDVFGFQTQDLCTGAGNGSLSAVLCNVWFCLWPRSPVHLSILPSRGLFRAGIWVHWDVCTQLNAAPTTKRYMILIGKFLVCVMKKCSYLFCMYFEKLVCWWEWIHLIKV